MEQQSIKNTIEGLLDKMGVGFDEITVVEEQSRLKFLIRTKESGLLIGYRGQHFNALSHLIKRIMRKRVEGVRFSIDVNDYREEGIKTIKRRALELAEEVKALKKELEMEPMSSYERMIVHSLFADDPYVETESVSKEGGRRVVLKYVSF